MWSRELYKASMHPALVAISPNIPILLSRLGFLWCVACGSGQREANAHLHVARAYPGHILDVKLIVFHGSAAASRVRFAVVESRQRERGGW